jgi:hypothetical protein
MNNLQIKFYLFRKDKKVVNPLLVESYRILADNNNIIYAIQFNLASGKDFIVTDEQGINEFLADQGLS